MGGPTRVNTMDFRFDFEKTLQASALILGLHGGRMESIRLLKLLYIADRELLAEAGRPITGDLVVAMKHGPVLSAVYDIIMGRSPFSSEWSQSIRTVHKDVEGLLSTGRGRLSRGDVEKLEEVCRRYQEDSVWDICEQTHEFAEWKQNYREGTSTRARVTESPRSRMRSPGCKRSTPSSIRFDEGRRHLLPIEEGG